MAGLALAALLLVRAARGDFAVVRPFATAAEVGALQHSFAAWNGALPCRSKPPQPMDLFLVYSRDISQDEGAQQAVAAVRSDFQAAGWRSCFRELKVLSANLTAEQDIYEPLSQGTNPNWVSGPNGVFRFILRTFLAGAYKSFFYMELDSRPQRADWLLEFLREASVPGVAIRGSRYRGDKWDDFLPHLPQALRVHINGNAIYNVQHPLVAWLSDQLHNVSGQDDVAFDVMMAELTLGIAGTTVWEELVPSGTDPYLGDSKLIGNYANTLVNSSFDGGEYVVHLAESNIFAEVEESLVTLAVSKFGDAAPSILSSSLPGVHPFRKIVILTTDTGIADGHSEKLSTSGGHTTVTWKRQRGPGNQTLCELANLVTTEFFVYTDSYHAIASPVSILVNGSKPALPFLDATSRYCTGDPRCSASLKQARDLFFVELSRHYEVFDTLWRTSHVKLFCASWARAEAKLVERKPGTCLPLLGPSADDYFAWLSMWTTTGQWYQEVNRELKGWRKWTFLHSAHPVDPRPCGAYQEQQRLQSAGNISYCRFYVERPQMCSANPACAWRPAFQSGSCIPSVPEPQDWTVTVTSSPTTSARTTKTATTTRTTTTVTTTTGTMTKMTTTKMTTAKITTTKITTSAATSTTVTHTTATGTLAATTTITATQGTTVTVTGGNNTSNVTALTRFGSCLLSLNASWGIPELMVKVRMGAELLLTKGTGKHLESIVVRVSIECKQAATFFLNTSAIASRQVSLDALLQAARKAFCYRLAADRCDLIGEGNATNLTFSQPSRTRRLQDVSGLHVPIEAIVVVDDESQLQDMRGLGSEAFLPALESELPSSDLAVDHHTDLAQAVVSYEIPEDTAPSDVAAIQGELLDPDLVTQAMVEASGDGGMLLGPPIVDLCLGRSCGGHGSCVAGSCQCDLGWTGISCTLATGEEESFTVWILPIKDSKVPLVVGLSVAASCLLWFMPCGLIFYRYRKARKEVVGEDGNSNNNGGFNSEVSNNKPPLKKQDSFNSDVSEFC